MLGCTVWMRSVLLLVPNAVDCCAHAAARDRLQARCSRDTRNQGLPGGEVVLEMSALGPSRQKRRASPGDTVCAPRLHTFELKNGIRVDFMKAETDMLCLNVSIDVGLAHTLGETPELAYLAKHMSTLLPRRFPAKHDLYEFYECYCMATTPSYTSFCIGFRADGFSRALERLYAGISAPCLDERAIKNEIPVIISELRFFYSSPLATHSFVKPLCFAGGDYLYDPRSIEGTEDLLRSGTREKLEIFYRRYYNAGGMRILLVGNYGCEQLQAHLDRTFGQIPSGCSEKPAFQMPRLRKEFANRIVRVRPSLVFAGGQCVSKLTITFPELPVDSFGAYVALHMLKGFLLESHRGGLKSFLMREKYAVKYSSSVCGDFKNSSYFEVTVILTEKGGRRVQEIADFLSLYLGVWKRNIRERHIATWRCYVECEIAKIQSDLSNVCSDEKVRYLVWLHNNFSLDDVLRCGHAEQAEKVDLRQLLDRFLRLGDIHYVHETEKEVRRSPGHEGTVRVAPTGSRESMDALSARVHGYFNLDKVFGIPFIPPVVDQRQACRRPGHLNQEGGGNRDVLLARLVSFAETWKTGRSGDLYALRTRDGVFECTLGQGSCYGVLKNRHGGVLRALFDRCAPSSRVVLSLDYSHLNRDPGSVVAFKIILEAAVDKFLAKHLKSMDGAQCTASFDNSLSPVFLAEFCGPSGAVLSFAAAFVGLYRKARDGGLRLNAEDLDRHKRLLCYRVSELFRGNLPPIVHLVAKEAFLNSHNILKTLTDGLLRLSSPSDLAFSGSARADLSVINIAPFKDSFKLFCNVGKTWRCDAAAKEETGLFQKRSLTVRGYIGHCLHNAAAVLIKMSGVKGAEGSALLAVFVSLIRPYLWRKVRADLGEYHCSLEVQSISQEEKALVVLICGQSRPSQLKDEIMCFVEGLPALLGTLCAVEMARKHSACARMHPGGESGTLDAGEAERLRSELIGIAEGLISGCDSVFILMDKDENQEIFMDFE